MKKGIFVAILNRIRFTALACISLFAPLNLHAIYHTNFFDPVNVDFRNDFHAHDTFRCGVSIEAGLESTQGYDGEGKKTSLLKAYAPHQSAQAMLANREAQYLASEDPEQWFASTIQQTYDGKWGLFDLEGGAFRGAQAVLWSHGTLPLPEGIPGKVRFSGYLPIRSFRVEDITWKDLTDLYDLGNHERIAAFTSQLKEFANRVGNLDLEAWSKVGQGDLGLLVDWYHEYSQQRDGIDRVGLNFGVGVTLPTARVLEEDVNKVFAIPLGYGGSLGIPLRAGLEVYPQNFSGSAGVALDLLFLSNTTRVFRLKTREEQTDYLLLSKGRATLQPATIWRLNIFARSPLAISGLTGMISYHFLKQGDSSYIPEDGTFLGTVINTSEAIKEHSSHDVVAQVTYRPENSGTEAQPHFSLFCKYSLGGKRSVRATIFGGEFSLSF